VLIVGRIGRAHGVRGAVVVTLTTDRAERVEPGSRLFDGATWLTVESSRAQPGGKWLVQFEGVGSREAAEALGGRELSAEPLEDGSMWISDLIGSRVVEVSGVERGTCVAILDNPAHDILELDSGALVPAPFIVSAENGVVTIDPPAGLFDL
jgi:16S rRNA processing protein RimM